LHTVAFEPSQRLLQIVDPEVEMINPADWDVVCDVRTPDEFIEDRLIGAINTPVLSNEQRAQVGTLYKQVYACDLLAPKVLHKTHQYFRYMLLIALIRCHMAGPKYQQELGSPNGVTVWHAFIATDSFCGKTRLPSRDCWMHAEGSMKLRDWEQRSFRAA